MSSPPPVTLELEDEHGNHESVVFDSPGGKVRVVVGEPGRHSAVWRIWANPNTSDVYIAARDIAGYQKWSLHETGEWVYQWISRHQAWEYAQTDERLIESWSPPPELGTSGWTNAFVIRVRHQDILPITRSLPTNVRWIPPPRENHAAAIFVVIARPDQPPMALQGLVPFGGFLLRDGRVVLFVASYQPLTDEQNRVLDRVRELALEQAPAGLDLTTLRSPRMLTAAHMSDGARSVWDMALLPESD